MGLARKFGLVSRRFPSRRFADATRWHELVQHPYQRSNRTCRTLLSPHTKFSKRAEHPGGASRPAQFSQLRPGAESYLTPGRNYRVRTARREDFRSTPSEHIARELVPEIERDVFDLKMKEVDS